MTTTLIGFLGRGTFSQDGQRQPYRRVRYQFESWLSPEVSFFLHAAHGWLQHKKRKPERLVVLGTPGSMWDELLQSRLEDPTLEQPGEIETTVLELWDRVNSQTVTREDLDMIECELSAYTGCLSRLN